MNEEKLYEVTVTLIIISTSEYNAIKAAGSMMGNLWNQHPSSIRGTQLDAVFESKQVFEHKEDGL